MKKLLLIFALLIFGFTSELYSQDEEFNNSTNIKIYNKIISTGTSKFTISVTKGNKITLPISFKKLEEIGYNKIEEFCRLNLYNFKIINIDKQKKALGKNDRIYNLTGVGLWTGNNEWIAAGAISSFINSQKQKIVTLTFNVSTKDGSFTMSKEQARIELIKLKELYDMDIITKSEFDKRAKPLKEIVLKTGN